VEDRASLIRRLKERARALRAEVHALYLAAHDPRTPWYAKALIWFVVAHTFSPIDLIPDFIPVLGYLDDLVITPLGLALALRLIPPVVLIEARTQTRRVEGRDTCVGLAGAAVIVLIWVVFMIWMVKFILAFGH
jgi:uncharacterized membrane protein YkvA (DUF1232 family)